MTVDIKYKTRTKILIWKATFKNPPRTDFHGSRRRNDQMSGCDLKDRSDPKNGQIKEDKDGKSIPYRVYKDEQYKNKLGDRAS